MNARYLSIAAVAALIFSPIALAQSGGSYPAPAQHATSQSFASTAEEGFLRGTADLGRAIGEQNYNSATAGLIGQDARTAAIENDYLAVKNYYKKKELNQLYDTMTRPPRTSAYSLLRFSRERAPDRLAAHQVDMTLGAIYWPALLEEPRFKKQREQLEALYEERASGSRGLGGRNYREVQVAADEMRERLQDILPEVEPAEYMVAKKFIDSLAYEARFPVAADSGEVNLAQVRHVAPRAN